MQNSSHKELQQDLKTKKYEQTKFPTKRSEEAREQDLDQHEVYLPVKIVHLR